MKKGLDRNSCLVQYTSSHVPSTSSGVGARVWFASRNCLMARRASASAPSLYLSSGAYASCLKSSCPLSVCAPMRSTAILRRCASSSAVKTALEGDADADVALTDAEDSLTPLLTPLEGDADEDADKSDDDADEADDKKGRRT